MTLIDAWDTGEPGATWDSGIQWDVNVGPGLGDVEVYARLITSEFNKQPNFMAMVRFMLAPFADNIAVLASMTRLFDINVAVGDQLDILGQWIGQSRQLSQPLTGVYFAFDTDGVGFDEGTWHGPFDPNNYLSNLPDGAYRLLLKTKILNNHWDGTIPDAYTIWDTLFTGTDFELLIQDFCNMHMLYALLGPTPDAVTLALFTGGYLNNRPAGVMVDAYVTPSEPDTPYFGFEGENGSISGFDVGAWGTLTHPV